MSRPDLIVITAGVVAAVVIVVVVAWVGPRVSRVLLRWAARHCFDTDELRERFAEEWIADLEDVPGRFGKLAHTLGVLLLAAVPIWVRSRWRRSRLARRVGRPAAPPGPELAGIAAGGGAVLARASALALTLALTGLLAVQSTESILRLIQDRPAPAATSAATEVFGMAQGGLLYTFDASNTSGQSAMLTFLAPGPGLQVNTLTWGITAGTAYRLYMISKDGKRHLLGTWTAKPNRSGYSSVDADAPALTVLDIKSFEVTTTRTPPVLIIPRVAGGESYYFAGTNTSGQSAYVATLPEGRGMQYATSLAAIPAGATCRLYVISRAGVRHLVGSWTTHFNDTGLYLYSAVAALAGPEIKSFEITTTRTPPVFIPEVATTKDPARSSTVSSNDMLNSQS
jgi:hypothetical protein